MGSFTIGGHSGILLDNQIKEDKMGGTCGTHGGKGKIVMAFVGKRVLARTGCKRRLILKLILQK